MLHVAVSRPPLTKTARKYRQVGITGPLPVDPPGRPRVSVAIPTNRPPLDLRGASTHQSVFDSVRQSLLSLRN